MIPGPSVSRFSWFMVAIRWQRRIGETCNRHSEIAVTQHDCKQGKNAQRNCTTVPCQWYSWFMVNIRDCSWRFVSLCSVIKDWFHKILPQWRRRILTLSQGAKIPCFLQCPKLCVESEDVERHVDTCWCKEVDEWGTGWVCHPEAGLLDSLASSISVELTVEGSRFPRLLCSVRVMLSHRWSCPCCRQHAAWSESATAAVEKGSPTTVW